jgi:hypothetical protein
MVVRTALSADGASAVAADTRSLLGRALHAVAVAAEPATAIGLTAVAVIDGPIGHSGAAKEGAAERGGIAA